MKWYKGHTGFHTWGVDDIPTNYDTYTYIQLEDRGGQDHHTFFVIGNSVCVPSTHNLAAMSMTMQNLLRFGEQGNHVRFADEHDRFMLHLTWHRPYFLIDFKEAEDNMVLRFTRDEMEETATFLYDRAADQIRRGR